MPPGQQCCYDKKGKLVDAGYKGKLPDGKKGKDCMGSVDVVGGAVGDYNGIIPYKRGCCTWNMTLVLGHQLTDVRDADCDKYTEVQECMRALGIPSGDQSGPPGGATVAEFQKAYATCMKEHGCKQHKA